MGVVTADVAERLVDAGFERHGRHWIHERHRLFLEFPDEALARGDTVARIRVGNTRALAERNGASVALDSLIAFVRTHAGRGPTHTEVEAWAHNTP